MFTTDQLKEWIQKAKDAANASTATADNSSLTDKIKNGLYDSANQIQSGLNALLEKGGLITQNEVDSLDSQIRDAKRKLLEAKSQETKNKLLTYTAIGVVIIGTFWIIIKAKQK